jgi:large subunit ribosomal protein L18
MKKKLKRKKIFGTNTKPRLSIFRSNTHIYAQLIDDISGHTLCSMSSLDHNIKLDIKEKTPSEIAEIVGKKLAEKALKFGIKFAVFDRNKYSYKGRIARLAKGARNTILSDTNNFNLDKLIF